MTYCATQTTNAFAAFDGNGNLTALVNAADGNPVAQYGYGPFGEIVRSTGPMAQINPFWFSTKHQDIENDLANYPRRPYAPSTGRWLSYDPITELGFGKISDEYGAPCANSYGFTQNSPIAIIDPLGLYREDFHFYAVYYLLRKRCFGPIDAYFIAYNSQYVDDDPETDPWNLGKSGQYAKLAQYHFAGSGPNTMTVRDDPTSRAAATVALWAWTLPGGGHGNAVAAGVALHLYADSWSHDRFTAWDNKAINDKLGPYPIYIGHANVGTTPDLPYEDPTRAADAAEKIYTIIPDLCTCPRASTSLAEISRKTLNMFWYASGNDAARIAAWKTFIKKDVGDSVTYKKQ
jgi:RHS repeat-associated protein